MRVACLCFVFVYGYPVIPPPFVEKVVFSPLKCLDTFIAN